MLVLAFHDHGIPSWQDVRDLGNTPTEDELRRVLADPSTACAVLFITPEVEDSLIIRDVEIPCVMKRVEKRDGFFAVPIAACGLDYAKAAEVTSNSLSAQDLRQWNMERFKSDSITLRDAAAVARRVLAHRVQALHSALPAGDPLRMAFFVRRPPAFELGNALAVDWSGRFEGKEAPAEVWDEILLLALRNIVDTVRQCAPGRSVEAHGLPTLPAATALGCAFIATGGVGLSWRQQRPGTPDQTWSLAAPRLESGFAYRIDAKDAKAKDLAVLVSVADDVEPIFASCVGSLPPLRALIYVRSHAKLPCVIESAGHAHDIARIVEDGARLARREYGAIGTVHLFMAVPAGLAVLIGQLMNTFGLVQTYEHVLVGGNGTYRTGPLLRPCA